MQTKHENTNPVIQNQEVHLIPLDQIKENPNNPRKVVDETGIAELAESIKVHDGVLQPVGLQILPDGSYMTIFGARRVEASKRAGKTEIRALLHEVSEEQAFIMAMTENLQQESMTTMDVARAFLYMEQRLNYSRDNIAAAFRMDIRYVEEQLHLGKLIPPLAKLVEQKAITREAALVLCRYNTKTQKEAYKIGYKDPNDWNTWRKKSPADLAGAMERAFTNRLSEYACADNQCQGCIKNTASHLLFSEYENDPRCLDKTCLDKKQVNYLAAQVEAGLKERPEVIIAYKDGSSITEQVVKKLQEAGHTVEKVGYAPGRKEMDNKPVEPNPKDYETGEEYSEEVKIYEAELKEYEDTLADINMGIAMGQITPYLMISSKEVIFMYEQKLKAEATKQEATPEATIVSATREKVDSQLAKDKRNLEIADEKIIDGVQRVMANAFPNLPWSMIEEAAFYFMLSHNLGEKDKKKLSIGSLPSEYSEPEKLFGYLLTMPEEDKIIFRRAKLRSFFGSYTQRDTFKSRLYLDVASYLHPKETKKVQDEQQRIYDKRHTGTLKRIYDMTKNDKVFSENPAGSVIGTVDLLSEYAKEEAEAQAIQQEQTEAAITAPTQQAQVAEPEAKTPATKQQKQPAKTTTTVKKTAAGKKPVQSTRKSSAKGKTKAAASKKPGQGKSTQVATEQAA